MKKTQLPLTRKSVKELRAGQMALISGVIYTARDQAHLRFSKDIKKNKKLPINLKGQVIYYAGPTPPGRRPVGSCGPTTSSRMDRFTPDVLALGLLGMIGKGRRSPEVKQAVKRNGAVYFLAPAGAGAYLSQRIISSRVVAFKDLGPEAVYRLEVKDFPVVVGIDSRGVDIYPGK
jgi:fumarate hydratase subunit beta